MKPIENTVNPKLERFVQEVRANLDESQVLESLIKELALHKLELAEFKRELAVIRAHQRMRDILLPRAKEEYSGRKQAAIDAGMPLGAEQGFYALEYDGRGRPFRWTGPGRVFHFDLHLDRSTPLRFTLHLAPWCEKYARGLRCFSDGVEIPLVKQPCNWAVEYGAVLLPREVLGVTRIEFLVAKTFSPALLSADAAADKRQLGVVFLDLTASEADDGQVNAYLEEADQLRQAARLEQQAPPASPAVATAELQTATEAVADLPLPTDTTGPAVAGLTGE